MFHTPKEGICVETQALWYTALSCASYIAKKVALYKNKKNNLDNKTYDSLLNISKKYKEESIKIKKSFIKNFILSKPPYIFNNLNKNKTSDKNISFYPLHAIFYSSLPGIPSLIDKKTGLNFIKYFIQQLNTDESQYIFKDYNNKLTSLFINKFINILCKYNLHNTVYELTEFIKIQILENKTLGTLGDNDLIHQKDDKDDMEISENFSYLPLISEFTRSFYQDYLGVKTCVPERKIYITPSIPPKLNTINYNLRFGYRESFSCHIKLSKKFLNISYVEIKGLVIKKPILVFLKIYPGFEQKKDKFKYKQIFIKLKFNKSDDLIKISFDSINTNLIKIKDIVTIGSSTICGIKQKIEIYNENLEKQISSLFKI